MVMTNVAKDSRSYQLVPEQHPGQANQIWIGPWTDMSSVAIRIPNAFHGDMAPYYDGVKQLFGYTYGTPFHYQAMYRLLRQHSELPIPELLSVTLPERTSFTPVHRFVNGQPAKLFSELSIPGAIAYGQHLGRRHSIQTTAYGSFGAFQTNMTFSEQAAMTIRHLLRAYPYDNETRTALYKAAAEFAQSSATLSFAPILIDLDPTQFFIDTGRFTCWIDIDFVLFGPPEFELIALEPHLTHTLAVALRGGYERVRQFPHLTLVRSMYRGLQRALCLQGPQASEEWQNAATFFE